MGRVAMLALAIVVPASPLAGQVLHVIAYGSVGRPETSAVIDGVREETAGWWGEAAVDASWARWYVSAAAGRGSLDPTTTSGIRQDVGQLSGRIGFAVAPWLRAEASYVTRAFASPAGTQRWNILGGGLRAETQLGIPGIRAYVRGAYLPYVGRRALESASWGIAGSAGVEFSLSLLPIVLEVSYAGERYAFPSDFPLEGQLFEMIRLRIGWPLSLGAELAED